MKIEVLKALRKKDVVIWQQLCESMPHCDIFYLPQYVNIHALDGKVKACCFVYQKIYSWVVFSANYSIIYMLFT